MSIPPLVLVVVNPVVAAAKGRAIPVNDTDIGWFIGKLIPVMVSFTPDDPVPAITPEVGDTVNEETVVVRLADAVLKYASVAEMMCVPGRKTGTTKDAINAP